MYASQFDWNSWHTESTFRFQQSRLFIDRCFGTEEKTGYNEFGKENEGKTMKKSAPEGRDHTPIVIYYYYDFTDTDLFCSLLEKRFRLSGHDRPLRFIQWNCYQEQPGRDGDLFLYDGVAMSALVDKGYLHELPEVIDTSEMFAWTVDKAKVRKMTYGIPMMICANALICRKKDDQNIRNILDLHEPTAVPLKPMLMYYYLQAFCNYQDESDRSLDVIRHIITLMGEHPDLEKTGLEEYDGVRRFIEGECRYFLGFTESLRLFPKDEYTVRFANFSDNKEDQMPLFMTDYASLGNHAEEEKLLDCLDLLEIMSDSQFIYELCTAGGKLQYMLPACRTVYPRLAELDPLYLELYEQLKSDENGVFRYGPDFYETFYQKGDELLALLKKEKPGS